MSANYSNISSFIQRHIPEQEQFHRLASDRLTAARVENVSKRIVGEGNLGEGAIGLILAHAILEDAQCIQGGSLAPLDAIFFSRDFCAAFLDDRNMETCAREAQQRIESEFSRKPILLYAAQTAPASLASIDRIPSILVNRSDAQYLNQTGVIALAAPGESLGGYFSPQLSGEGISWNPFAWHPRIDPKDGAMRLIFGSGTRLTAPLRDDFSRLVAIGEPRLRPESTEDEIRRYGQRRVHVFDEAHGDETSLPLEEWAGRFEGNSFARWLYQDEEWMQFIRGENQLLNPSLDPILERTEFVEDVRRILAMLTTAFGHTVVIEFAVQFTSPPQYDFYVTRCCFDSTLADESKSPVSESLSANCLFQARHAVIGRPRLERIERLIYIHPAEYAAMNEQSRYSVARLIGRLMRPSTGESPPKTLLLGPGRWGTTTPSLGVPVSFAEIAEAVTLGEIAAMHAGLIPELSMGAHFFQGLVDRNIPWFGLRLDAKGVNLDQEQLLAAPNRLLELQPESHRLAEVVRVIDYPNRSEARSLYFYLNAHKCLAIGYLSAEEN